MIHRDTFEILKQIWNEVEKNLRQQPGLQQRIYRRLDLEKETGIRLGCSSPGAIWEFLVEAAIAGEELMIEFPKWKGMNFEVVALDIPRRDSKHIRLFLQQQENRDIFVTVCADLVRALNDCTTNESRRNEIINFLARWSYFFERYGQQGLSPEKQQGLYGELWLLRRLIQENVEYTVAVNSWKGCRRNYHDFETNGHVTEVKTTTTKEPRKVQINNERQLDDRGLISLHLLVLTLKKSDSGGETLPAMVESLRNILAQMPASHSFENSLRDAGYLDIHSQCYDTISYSVIKEEFFHVGEGFPRITDMPLGLGDLHYALIVAACEKFKNEFSEYFKLIGGK